MPWSAASTVRSGSFTAGSQLPDPAAAATRLKSPRGLPGRRERADHLRVRPRPATAARAARPQDHPRAESEDRRARGDSAGRLGGLPQSRAVRRGRALGRRARAHPPRPGRAPPGVYRDPVDERRRRGRRLPAASPVRNPLVRVDRHQPDEQADERGRAVLHAVRAARSPTQSVLPDDRHAGRGDRLPRTAEHDHAPEAAHRAGADALLRRKHAVADRAGAIRHPGSARFAIRDLYASAH